MPQFLIPPGNSPGDRIPLSEEESHHVRNVFRLQRGAEIQLTDGTGQIFLGRIEEIGIKIVTVFLEKQLPSTASNQVIVLWQGLLKGEKMDWLVQKATELGLTELRPFVSSRCVARITDRDKSNRWQRISDEAMKQCGRADQMKIFPPVAFNDIISHPQEGIKILFDKRDEKPLSDLRAGLRGPQKIHLMVGPEGGLTEEEVAQVTNLGFTTTSLGPLTLRSETAALAALSMIQYETR